MLTKEGLEFLLRITDYFKGHWEDPGWGHKPINQVLILVSARTLANGIADADARRQVQTSLDKALVQANQQIAR
jgi:hypothetical protein